MEFNKQTSRIIAEQIEVTPQEFEFSMGEIIEIVEADPEQIEIVKIWKIHQVSPDDPFHTFDYWYILVFNPNGGEDGNEYYVLLDVVKWGEERDPELAPGEENIVWSNGNTRPIEPIDGDDRVIKLIFESEAHEPQDFFFYSDNFPGYLF